MAVGAGSIKRASRINTDAARDESVQKVEEEIAASKRTERTKEATTAKKSAKTKEVTGTKRNAKPKEVTEQNSVTTNKREQKNIKNGTQVLQNTANKVYHITEELPIYLL